MRIEQKSMALMMVFGPKIFERDTAIFVSFRRSSVGFAKILGYLRSTSVLEDVTHF